MLLEAWRRSQGQALVTARSGREEQGVADLQQTRHLASQQTAAPSRVSNPSKSLRRNRVLTAMSSAMSVCSAFFSSRSLPTCETDGGQQTRREATLGRRVNAPP